MIPKFKAWHKELKTMFEVKSLVFTLNLATIVSKNDLVPSRTCSFDDIIFMQSTGLFDNSTPKKEISEGDVLRDSESIVIVKFKDGKFNVDYRTMGGKWRNYGSLFDYLKDYEGEIIGNIYQNKEWVK